MKLSVKSSDQWILHYQLCLMNIVIYQLETEAEQYEVSERETTITNVPSHCYAAETETWKQENHLTSIT